MWTRMLFFENFNQFPSENHLQPFHISKSFRATCMRKVKRKTTRCFFRLNPIWGIFETARKKTFVKNYSSTHIKCKKFVKVFCRKIVKPL